MIRAKRHIAKTISYRAISTMTGFFAIYTMTGSINMSSAFSILEITYKPLIYFIHERIWYKYIKFGIQK